MVVAKWSYPDYQGMLGNRIIDDTPLDEVDVSATDTVWESELLPLLAPLETLARSPVHIYKFSVPVSFDVDPEWEEEPERGLVPPPRRLMDALADVHVGTFEFRATVRMENIPTTAWREEHSASQWIASMAPFAAAQPAAHDALVDLADSIPENIEDRRARIDVCLLGRGCGSFTATYTRDGSSHTIRNCLRGPCPHCSARVDTANTAEADHGNVRRPAAPPARTPRSLAGVGTVLSRLKSFVTQWMGD